MTEERIKELRDKIQVICEEYKNDCSILAIITPDDTNRVMISGNACPVCNVGTLVGLIMLGELQHTDVMRKTEDDGPEFKTKH